MSMRDLIEPQADDLAISFEGKVMLSQAISLKRIADALAGRPGEQHPIAQAISDGMHYGAEAAIAVAVRSGRL